MMKKVLIFLSFVSTWLSWSQSPPIQDIKMSPNGYFDTVLDRYGNQYQLKDLQAGKDLTINQTLSKSAAISCDSGIFELYFETGSGMENTADATHNARRAVVCRVFKDLSDFINTPLKNAGNTTKVKIWVRNPSALSTPMPSNALGLATSFYTMPNNTAANFGGIIDGEVFKTIQGGKDSYVNVAAPLVNSDGSLNSSGIYYHGMMAFNFNLPSPKTWNTNLLATTITSNEYDLYSVVLHEVTHALGFNSLLNYDGNSVFGTGYKYYTRYDRFLKNSANSQFLLTNTGACSLYNYGFNGSTSVLVPGCTATPPTSTSSSNSTNCLTAIRFVGTNNTPVYTPNCFEQGSSCSHFEDMCITPANNDGYFTMSNAINTGIIKRFLKPEERNALQDIGYSLSMTYGNNSVVANSNNPYTNPTLTALDVAGINDGIASNRTFSFIGNSGTTISITGILNNDYNATSFECVQDVFDTTATFSTTSGTSTATIDFTSNVSGLHLLRYVPVNAAGKKGNITYIYVYVQQVNTCGIPTTCNLVINGDFVQKSALPNTLGEINKACGWESININSTPDYFYFNSASGNSLVQIPCNFFGSETDRLGLNGYAGMWIQRDASYLGLGGNYFESVWTKLSMPLNPNTDYSISFDVSLAEGSSANAIKFQAYLSPNIIVSSGLGSIPIANPSMLFTNPTFSTIANGWQRITFNFNSGNNTDLKYLYIGGLSNVEFNQITPAALPSNCSTLNYNIGAPVTLGYSYYYVDNVNLIPLNGANFDLPTTVCNNFTISNLTTYLSATPTNGVFTGNGVAFDVNSGNYSFNATTAGVGTHTITYTYTNSSNCSISISDTIQVLPSSDPSCSVNNCPGALTFTTTELAPLATYQAGSTITTTTNYLVNGGSTITLKAGNSITFSPSSEVKANSSSNFTAQIAACSPSSARTTEALDKEVTEQRLSDELVVYPNPTKDNLILEIRNDKISRILITTLEGKIVFEKLIEETNSYQLDISSYQNGLYMLNIETIGGQLLNRKIIKN